MLARTSLETPESTEERDHLVDAVDAYVRHGAMGHPAKRGNLQPEGAAVPDTALRVMESLGKPDRAAILTEIARTHLHDHRLEEAEVFAERALQSAGDVRDPVECAEAQLLLARIHLLGGRMKKALPLLEEALPAFRRHGMEWKAAEALRELGLLLREQGAHAEAATFLALAVDFPRGEAESH